MRVVPFERKSDTINEAPVANNNEKTAEVIQLNRAPPAVRGIEPNPLFRQFEAMIVASGVNLSCPASRNDFKIATYLIQGLLDRANGVTSDRYIMLDVIRDIFADEVPLPHGTNELFGDLLGQLDSIK